MMDGRGWNSNRSLRITLHRTHSNERRVGQSKDDRWRASVRYGANPSPRGCVVYIAFRWGRRTGWRSAPRGAGDKDWIVDGLRRLDGRESDGRGLGTCGRRS